MKKFISFITSVIMISSMTGSMAYAEGTWLPGGGYIPEGMEVDETPKAPDIVREPVDPELTAKLKAIYEQLQQFDDAHSTIFFNEGINNKILFTSTDQDIVDKVNLFIENNCIDKNLVSAELEFPEEALLITEVTTDEPLETVTAVTSSVQQQTIVTTTTSDSNENRVDLKAFYEEIKEYSEEASAKYRKMTVDEAYKDILGNYVILSAESGNLKNHLLVMDENAKLHGMMKIQTETCVKVKSGTELPDIPSSIRYWINEDVYVLKSDDMNEVNEYVGSIKNNENILAIDNHYGVYEDTINDFRIEGLRYDGDELTEEFFADYPHLGLKLNESDTKDNRHSMYCKIDKNAEPSIIFNEMVSLKESVSGIDAVFIQTEAWLETPVMYYCSYCNSPTLIDGLDGDANIDGDMDISDAVMIMQSLANPNKYAINGTAEHHLTEQGKLNGDMNGDGLTVGDAQAIQRKLLGLDKVDSQGNDNQQLISVQYESFSRDYPYYNSVSELATKANQVFSGRVTNVSFEMLNMMTMQPIKDGEDTQWATLCTIYEIEAEEVYAGTPTTVKLRIEGGIQSGFEQEQIALLGNGKIPVMEDAPVLTIGEKYLFALYHAENAEYSSILNPQQSVYTENEVKEGGYSAAEIIAYFQ